MMLYGFGQCIIIILLLFYFIFILAMECDASCSMVYCGKSSVEDEIATRLKKDNVLKLSDDTQVSLLLQSEDEAETLLLKDYSSFDLSLFMDYLTAHRFGRFLIWSPRLSTTHDVVSQ